MRPDLPSSWLRASLTLKDGFFCFAVFGQGNLTLPVRSRLKLGPMSCGGNLLATSTAINRRRTQRHYRRYADRYHQAELVDLHAWVTHVMSTIADHRYQPRCRPSALDFQKLISSGAVRPYAYGTSAPIGLIARVRILQDGVIK